MDLQIVKLFNRQLLEFATELTTMYPEDSLFGAFRTAIDMLAKSTPRKCIEMFKTFVVVPYKTQLLSHDEVFFMDKDYTEEVGDPEQFDIIPKIKGYWKGMTSESKNAIWDYSKVLITLCDKYDELN